jgi:glucose/arabinose dehydrogenase
MKYALLCFLLAGGGAFAGCGDDSANPGGGTNTGGSGAGNAGGNDVGGFGGAGANFNCEPASDAPPALTLTELSGSLDSPVSAKSPPGRPDDLFVVEQGGTIRIVNAGGVVDAPFLDISDLIQCCGEEGLLGVAFHPDYATNGRFFVHYSNQGNGDSTVMEYHRSDADPDVADPDPVELVLQHDTAESNHNGGDIAFGPDGFLYITLGDGGAQGDPGCDAQNPENLLGKISRVDVDKSGYPPAAGNPGGAAYYHIGFRNPWRIAFDPCNGDLYIGDVGQNEWEEVSVALASDGPQNFGWPLREGAHDYPNDDCDVEPTNPVEPIAEYPHEDTAVCGAGSGSITGGFVHRGSAVPALRGWYFYADYCSGNM